MTKETAPLISVVIAAHNGRAYLESCLESLQVRPHHRDVEIIAVVHQGTEQARWVTEKSTTIRKVEALPECSVPKLRAAGMLAARGRYVALLEDHCRVDSRWIETLIRLHEAGCPVVGGAVENGMTGSWLDWAIYLWEYSPFINPMPDGVTRRLPGNNVSFSREALDVLQPMLDEPHWELDWYTHLFRHGIVLHSSPDLVVIHQRSFPALRFWRFTVLHGRNYAATRPLRNASERMARLVTAPLLPLVILARIAGYVFRRRRHRAIAVACFPYLLWFAIGFSLGEGLGYAQRRAVPDPGWGTA